MKRMMGWLTVLLLCLTGCTSRFAAASTAPDPTEITGYIALTFDDGPSPLYTSRLLDGLKERDAHATFFVVGQLIPGQEELLRRMAAEGHQIGNHTQNHRDLSKLTLSQAQQETALTAAALEEVLGPGERWIRPPYGFISDAQMAATEVPLVYWSVDTEDWSLRDKDRILDGMLRQIGDGDIVLMHDIYPTSVEAALAAVDHFRAKGYRFVTLEELFALRGKTPPLHTLIRGTA